LFKLKTTEATELNPHWWNLW